MKLDPRLLSAAPVAVLVLTAVAMPLAEGADALPPAPAAVLTPAPAGPEALAAAPLPRDAPTSSALAPQLGAPRLDPELGRYVAPYGSGTAVLTLSTRLQESLTRTLRQYAVPWGVTVLIEPATGRVLAMAEHSRAEPEATGLALRALAPAASIFKLVTAAALLERGVSPDEEVCFHGGRRRLDPRLLADDPRRDRRCTTLETAFGRSTNVVFAKLADRGLSPEELREAASRFLFNTSIPFACALERSPAYIDADPFQLANTAAGFGPVRLSPLHAALLASIVANDGLFVPPVLVDEVEGAPAPAVSAPTRVVDPGVAAALREMMRGTVTDGTARKTFRRARSSLRGVQVAGKTGSLSDRSPFRDYTWFVGFAPADHPEVAVATVIVNERTWRVHAPAVAREALEAFFEGRIADARPAQSETRVAHAGVR
jgi:peptidoglycan glycosyltransferase